jgi:hypothetical protein
MYTRFRLHSHQRFSSREAVYPALIKPMMGGEPGPRTQSGKQERLSEAYPSWDFRVHVLFQNNGSHGFRSYAASIP